MRRAIIGAALTLFGCCCILGQTAEAPTVFEVASVKLAPPPDGGRIRVGCSGGPGSTDPGLYSCFNADISQLVSQAYGLKTYQLSSYASGIFVRGDADRFNITAKVPPGATKDQLKLMLQSLLAERFKLKFHYDKKEMQVYDLVVAKGGPKMKESAPQPPAATVGAAFEPPPPPPPPPGGGRRMTVGADGFPDLPPARRGGSSMAMMNGRARWSASDVTVDQLVATLSSQVGRPITDSTGLKGKYDFTLTWVADNLGGRGGPGISAAADGGAPAAAEIEGGPTIFAAVQEQLGLRLEQKKGTVDMFVIDHVEKAPTEN